MEGLIRLKSKSFNKRIEEATGLSRNQFENVVNTRTFKKELIFYLDVGCNSDCVHCFGRKLGDVDVELTTNTVKKAQELGYRALVYASEPSLNPEIFKLYKITNTPFAISNGINWSTELLNKFKRSGVKRLDISLHGPDPETHAIIAGSPKYFNTIVDTIKRANKKFYIGIRYVIHTENIDKLEEEFHLLRKLDVPEIRLINLVKEGNAKKLPNKMFLKNSDATEVVRIVMNLIQKYDKPYVSFAQSFGPNFYSKGVYTWLIGKSHELLPQGRRWCPAGIDFFGVLNKDIYACPNSIAVPEFKVGEFSESGLKLEREMWPEKLGNKLKGMCSPKNCEYNQFCQGGCRGFVWTYTKDFYGSPPFCLTKILDALALEQ